MGSTSYTAQVHGRVLAVAEPHRGATIAEALEGNGHTIETASSLDVAADANAAHDLVLVDADLAHLVDFDGDHGPFLVVTTQAHPGRTFDGAVGVVSLESLPQVFDALIHMAVRLRDLRVHCDELERLTEGLRDGSAMVGRSPVMRRLADAIRRAADGDVTVLIEGHPGTGKSMAARVMHCKSRRGSRPIVVSACEALEAEDMTRLLEEAQSTTLVLEEVDRMPQSAQATMVKFLKERPRPTEGTRARIIATTSAHLPELVAKGAFREDLYYRLNVFPLRMPGLRERPEDIGLLAETFMQGAAAQGTTPATGFTPAAMILLESLPWPGNVAQLESVIKRAHALAAGGPVDRVHLTGPTTGLSTSPEPRSQEHETETTDLTEEMIRPFEEEEQRLLSRALQATRGNVRRAAQLLGIGRATLYRKIQQFRLRLH